MAHLQATHPLFMREPGNAGRRDVVEFQPGAIGQPGAAGVLHTGAGEGKRGPPGRAPGCARDAP
eukprot:9904632-Alexandrium_andersonii.AAC.1